VRRVAQRFQDGSALGEIMRSLAMLGERETASSVDGVVEIGSAPM